jgi:hypothetical protein
VEKRREVLVEKGGVVCARAVAVLEFPVEEEVELVVAAVEDGRKVIHGSGVERFAKFGGVRRANNEDGFLAMGRGPIVAQWWTMKMSNTCTTSVGLSRPTLCGLLRGVEGYKMKGHMTQCSRKNSS